MGFTIIGWVGVVLFVLAYLLLSLEVLSSKKPLYHWLNALGAIGLVINAVGIADYPTITVNGIWGAIAVFSIIKLMWKRG